MAHKDFDSDEAKKYLAERELHRNEELESRRKELLAKAIQVLRDEFKNTSTEVFLVGSITRPYSFTERSDIDIVLKNFSGDRFDLWTKMEEKLEKPVEIINYDSCNFKEFVETQGLKVC